MIRNGTYRFSNLGEQDDRQVPDQYTLWSPPPLVIIVKNEKWEYSSFTFKTLFSLSLSFENDYDPNFQNERKVFLWEFIDNEPWDTHKVYEKDVWRHRAPLCQNATTQIISRASIACWNAIFQWSTLLQEDPAVLSLSDQDRVQLIVHNSTYCSYSW